MFKKPYKPQLRSALLLLSTLFIMSSFFLKSTQTKERTIEQNDIEGENKNEFHRQKQEPTEPGQTENENYTLNPTEWNIVEGKVSDQVALRNRLQLEAAFREAVKKKADTFKIGKLDAYFNVAVKTRGRKWFQSWQEGITIPANFNLKMSQETHLRAQPNNIKRYALFTNGTNDNITITGGNLYGERNTHTYSGESSDEWGHVVDFIGLENAVIDGVTIKDGNGDGMTIHELHFTFDPKHDKSRNIKIINCTFDNNRRNNLAITGGAGILVEKNLFLNAGQDTPTSKGTSPKAAIDVEPYKERDKSSGKLVHYEKTENIIIRNNTERNSAWQGFTVATGRDVLIEDNELESSINFGYSDSVIIRNNRMVNPSMGGVGMTLGESGARVFNNKVYNNVVKNFEQAISVRGNGHAIYDNNFSNFNTGLRIYDLKNSKIYNNDFKSERKKCYGLFIHVTSIENSIIENNSFTSDREALHIVNMNLHGKQNNKVILKNNTFKCNQAMSIGNSNGVDLLNNSIEATVRISNSNKINLRGNTINSGNSSGIELKDQNKEIQLLENTITSQTNCILIKEQPKNLVQNNNNCLKPSK